MIDDENKKNEGPIEIVYTRAKFTRRLFANLVDLLIFALLGICRADPNEVRQRALRR